MLPYRTSAAKHWKAVEPICCGKYFGLKNAKSGDVLHYAPNNWKTEKGALNWAKKNGYKIA